MRRLCITVLVAAAAVLVPTWTWAGNQEVAEQIAANLRESGQLQNYKVGVKFQDGTAWLKGQVSSAEQMSTALRLAKETPGVLRVVNNLTVPGQHPAPEPKPNPLPQALKVFQPGNSAQGLQQASGAVAPEQFAPAAPVAGASAGPYSDGSTRTAEQLQNAAVSRLPAPAPKVQRVPTTVGPSAVQPTGAMASAARDQGMPLAIAYTQAPVPEGMQPEAAPQPAPVPPQPIPAGAPQPIPAGVPQPMPQYGGPVPTGAMPSARYDQPYLPNYAWPGYTAYPNYAGVSYPRQYSPMAWPYIGPFYPYPQAPLGWRKVTLEWHDGWWFLDFDDCSAHGWFSGLLRHHE